MGLTKVVVSDIHSRQNKLVALLQQVGVLDLLGNRLPGFQLIQLGDAVSAGYGMIEADFYRFWTGLLTDDDVELVGNHEAPVLWNYDERFQFYGYAPEDMALGGCDPDLRVEILARQSRYQMATAVGEWLISHAGIYYKYDSHGDPGQAARYLNKLWQDHIHAYDPHPWYDCVICDNIAGVLWGRGLHKNYEGRLNQIIGHTPIGPFLDDSERVWLIDTPRLVPMDNERGTGRTEAERWGGVAALVTEDDGENWELHYVK